MLIATQAPSGTPRNVSFVSQPSALYIQTVRASLLRLFHDAFDAELVLKTPDLSSLENILLANSVTGLEPHPVEIISRLLGAAQVDILTPTRSAFVRDLLYSTSTSDESVKWRIDCRDQVIRNVLSVDLPISSNLESAIQILLACPFQTVASDESFRKLVCGVLKSREHPDSITRLIVTYLVKILHACTETDLQHLQTDSNILLALSDLVVEMKADIFTISDTLGMLRTRQEALQVLSVALALSPDPLAFLNLRRDAFDKTIGQKAFAVLFSELLLESKYRYQQALPEMYSTFFPTRWRRIKDSTNILTRMASLEPATSPLDEYSVLIPSLFGLIQSIIAKPSTETEKFDKAVKKMLQGDLVLIKELGAPELVGTPLEIEHSIWS